MSHAPCRMSLRGGERSGSITQTQNTRSRWTDDKRERAKAQRKADPPVSLFDIVIPLAPFGIPGVWAVAEHLLRPMNAFRMIGVEDHLRAG